MAALKICTIFLDDEVSLGDSELVRLCSKVHTYRCFNPQQSCSRVFSATCAMECGYFGIKIQWISQSGRHREASLLCSEVLGGLSFFTPTVYSIIVTSRNGLARAHAHERRSTRSLKLSCVNDREVMIASGKIWALQLSLLLLYSKSVLPQYSNARIIPLVDETRRKYARTVKCTRRVVALVCRSLTWLMCLMCAEWPLREFC